MFRLTFLVILFNGVVCAQNFQNVEVFRYDGRSASDGRTAFCNGNSTLTTDQRIDVLSTYVDQLRRLYHVDPMRSPITDDEVREALARLKPRPLPTVRRETDLVSARVMQAPRAYRTVYRCDFEPGAMGLEDWESLIPIPTDRVPYGRAAARLLSASGERTRISTRPDRVPLRRNTFYRLSFDYRVLASPEPAARLNFAVESPAASDRFLARACRRSWREGMGVSGRNEIEFRTGPRDDFRLAFSSEGGIDWLIDNLRLEEVLGGEAPKGWNQPGFDDAAWSECAVPQPFPHTHTTLLRMPFEVHDARRVSLYSAGIRGPITIWINGQEALKRRNEHPFTLDLTRYARVGSNLLAIRVDPEYRGQGPQGRLTILETAPVYLTDLFVSTVQLGKDAAQLRWRVTVHNPTDRPFRGDLRLAAYPWLPEESERSAVEARLSASVPAGATRQLEGFVSLPRASLWSPESPALYRARVVLREGREEMDDLVDSFGVRTIAQKDGEIYLNGRPLVVRGAGDFSVYPPLSSADYGAAVPPRELLARNILLLKRMHANNFRWFPGLGLSALDYETLGHPSNDELIPQLCDQLGMMLQWGAGFWVWQGDHRDDWQAWFSEAIAPAVTLLRNHPSVVIWEAGNENWHGLGRQTGTPLWSEWWDACYERIRASDDSRLILPSSYGIANGDIERSVAGEPVAMPRHWRAPDVLWDVHFYPGWYEEWDYLSPRLTDARGRRHWLACVGDNDKDHRPFVFGEYGAEAMPVWDLYTREDWNVRWMHWDNLPMGRFEEKNIGRPLQLSEWPLSQGYQALALQYVTTMGRIYNVDGFMVCALSEAQRLDGTYHKGVCDIYRIPKYGYYSLAMVYQDLYLTSLRGDLVLGGSDRLAPLLFNSGAAATVKGRIMVETPQGETLASREFGPLEIPAHGSVEPCGPLKVDFPGEGTYVMRAEIDRVP